MKNLFVIALLSFVGSYTSHAQEGHIHYLPDPDAAERNHSVDIQHMKVTVSFIPEQGKVMGHVEHTFSTLQKKIDTLFFDGPGISIESAEMDGKALKFRVDSAGVTVFFEKSLTWSETHKISFKYTALPKKGIYFIGWNQPENTGKPDIDYIRKQIWTQGQGVDNRFWIPMYDCMNDKFTTETVVTMKNPYKVLSNGKKVEVKDNGNGTSTWHYHLEKPHAGYLLMLGIGNYEVRESKTKRGTPVQFWYYPEFKERVEPTCLRTERMIELLEEQTGIDYPWGSYSQIMVQNFLYGAMENTSATIFGDFFTVDAFGFKDRNYLGVNCHELTHQWFGDLITARGGNDVWMQESFATFYPKLFFKELYGDDEYQWMLRREYESAIAAGLKDSFPVRHTRGGTARNYPKGSAVLSMLRYQLGDESFNRFVKHYLTVNGFKNVEAWDFQKAIKDKLGLNYDWFFDQWIHRGGEPSFEVNYTTSGNQLKMSVKQTHKVDGYIRYFRAPVNIAVYYKDGSRQVHSAFLEAEMEQNIEFALNGSAGNIAFVLFDEESHIMKTVKFEKSEQAWKDQAVMSKFMIDRYDAIVAMKNQSLSSKFNFLMGRFQAEKHHAIRAEIAKQLANSDADDVIAFYESIVADDKSEVKTAWLSADTLVAKHLASYIALMKDSSNVVAESALSKVMKCKDITDEKKRELLSILNGRIGQSHNIRVSWLEYAIQYNFNGKSGVKEYTNELILLVGPRYEFRTRVAAAEALANLKIFNAQVFENMTDAIVSYNRRLAGPVRESLKSLKSLEDNKKLFSKLYSKLSQDQKDALKRMGIEA